MSFTPGPRTYGAAGSGREMPGCSRSSVRVQVDFRVIVEFNAVIQTDPVAARPALQTADFRQCIREGEDFFGQNRAHIDLQRPRTAGVVGVFALGTIDG